MEVLESIYCLISDNASEIIALSALGLAIWQGLAFRKHNRLSVKPHLKFEHVISSVTPQVSITLSNNGVGPAYIKYFSVFLDGKQIGLLPKTLWGEVISKLNFPFIWGGGKEIHGEYSIASNKTVTIFKAKTTDKEEDTNFNEKQAQIEIERVHIIVKYESVYGKKFIEKFNEI